MTYAEKRTVLCRKVYQAALYAAADAIRTAREKHDVRCEGDNSPARVVAHAMESNVFNYLEDVIRAMPVPAELP